jgi:two-component system, OmpR family, response regulator VicR
MGQPIETVIKGKMMSASTKASALLQPTNRPTMTGKILVADDDRQLGDVIRISLERDGYTITQANDGEQALDIYRQLRPDLVILDVMMPKLNGWEVCRRLRAESSVPIIMLTARGQEQDRVMGLRMGADDYITKPFSLKELAARVEAVLRRVRETSPAREGLLYRDDYLVIDNWGWRVTCQDRIVDLTAVERHMLLNLVLAAGKTLSVDHLLHEVWGGKDDSQSEYVKLYIRRLRQKIEPDPDTPRYIATERGRGYRFVAVAQRHPPS